MVGLTVKNHGSTPPYKSYEAPPWGGPSDRSNREAHGFDSSSVRPDADRLWGGAWRSRACWDKPGGWFQDRSLTCCGSLSHSSVSSQPRSLTHGRYSCNTG